MTIEGFKYLCNSSLEDYDHRGGGGGGSRVEREKKEEIPLFEERLTKALSQVDKRYVERLMSDVVMEGGLSREQRQEVLAEKVKAYVEVQKSLIEADDGKQTDADELLTRFTGGPMDWSKYDVTDGWLGLANYVRKNPDQEHHQEAAFQSVNFHILSVNCEQGRNFDDAEVIFNFATDDELKLNLITGDNEKQDLERGFKLSANGKKTVIIRPALVGSLAYPMMASNYDINQGKVDVDVILAGLHNICERLGLKVETSVEKDEALRARIQTLMDKQVFKEKEGEVPEGWKIGEEKKFVMAEEGVVYATDVICEDSVWRNYRIYSRVPLRDIDTSRRVFVRVDSGCDIGMNYGDGGCDCHLQLRLALKNSKDRNALVIHLPTQDGRGYGANTKSYTEGWKHGVEPKDRSKIEPIETVEAAKKLLGDDSYDTRSYRHAGLILQQLLGIRTIELFTDNQKKLYSMKQVFGRENGEVKHRPTNTILEMIEAHENADAVLQMLLKTINSANYGFNSDEVRDLTIYQTLVYIGRVDMLTASLERRIQTLQNELRTYKNER